MLIKHSRSKHRDLHAFSLEQLCNPRPACGPVKVFAVVKVSDILTTCPYFDNLEFDIFDTGGPQCHFITSVTIAVRIRTLSVHLTEFSLLR